MRHFSFAKYAVLAAGLAASVLFAQAPPSPGAPGQGPGGPGTQTPGQPGPTNPGQPQDPNNPNNPNTNTQRGKDTTKNGNKGPGNGSGKSTTNP
jgi:hypothetical protein